MSGAASLTCRELVDFLDAYRAETLPDTERAVFDAHLAACPDCRAYLRAYDATGALIRAVRTDPGASPPADLPEDLVQAILRSRRVS